MTSKELRRLYDKLYDINSRLGDIMKELDRRYIDAVLKEKELEKGNKSEPEKGHLLY